MIYLHRRPSNVYSIRIRHAGIMFFALMFGMCLSVFTAFAEELQWKNTLEAANEYAQKIQRPVLLFVTADIWCDPCILLENNILSDTQMVQLINATVVPFRVVDTSPIMSQLNIKKIPTLILLSDKKKEISRISGYVKNTALREWLVQYTTKVSQKDRTVSLEGAVFLVRSGTLWHESDKVWHSQDANLPVVLTEYERDETFLYLRNNEFGVALAIDKDNQTLWEWNKQENVWSLIAEMQRIDN